jgi:hypothetical protein
MGGVAPLELIELPGQACQKLRVGLVRETMAQAVEREAKGAIRQPKALEQPLGRRHPARPFDRFEQRLAGPELDHAQL